MLILRVLILFVLCFSIAKIMMILGYALYLPEFGSWVTSDYKAIMRFQFSVLGIICATTAFFLAKVLQLNLKVTLITFVVAGIGFNFYSPEGNQQHWFNGFIQLSPLYMLSGLLMMYILYFIEKTRKGNARST